ncbi:MAG: YafY family transcriptional regulator [Spirochaetaceae bacterium]|nr:MAG: YafY family transcriptional regulator [Spirochaetaceae bacterium]
MKIDRLLSIVLLLLNRGKVTAPELAEYFETSIRTIYRDIETLCIAGIPVISQQGTGGGFSISPNFKMDRQVFTSSELLALITGLKGVQSAFRDPSVSAAIEKVKALVPEAVTADKSVVIDFSTWDYNTTQHERMSVLYKAVLSRRLVKFEYANLQNETTTRTVEPIRLYFKGSAWYLLSFCLLKSDYRFFRVSRIHDPVMLEKTFKPRPDEEKTQGMEWRTKPGARLLLKFPADARGRLFGKFDDNQIKANPDGTLQVTAVFPTDEWVYGLLLGLADVVEVLEPAEIRNELLRRTGIFFKINSKLTD